MNGKMNAIAMTLLMIASALAGCAGGDPDGDGDYGIDTDTLNQMIEDNLQDFINNTTVTVNQEIHYHNNTTYIIDDSQQTDVTNHNYHNNTTIDGGEVNNFHENNDYSISNYTLGSSGVGGNGTYGIIYMVDITFRIEDVLPTAEPEPDYRNNTIDYQYEYYDYPTNSNREDIFTIQCSDFYLVGSQSENYTMEVSYWEDSDHYWNAWVDIYNQTIANMLQQAAYDYYEWPDENYDYHVRIACDENYNQETSTYSDLVLAEITIPEGFAFACLMRNTGYGQSHPSEQLYRWTETYTVNGSTTEATGIWESYHWSSDQTKKRIYGDDYYCYWGMVAGDSETTLTVSGHYDIDMDADNLYRFVMYYQLIPIVNTS